MLSSPYVEFIANNKPIENTESNLFIINTIFSFESVKAVVVYIFLFYIGITLFKFLYNKNDGEKILQKIIGGLGVFIVAILSNNAVVFFTSLFIGGLIIASEDFMMFLAAIMKTQSDKIAETVGALKAEKASNFEIEEKIKKEEKKSDEFDIKISNIPSEQGLNNNALEITKTEEPKRQESKYNEIFNARLRKVQLIESLVQPKLIELFGPGYEPHIRLTNGKLSIIVDGVIYKNKKIKQVVEIKYISSASYANLKYLIARLREKLIRLCAPKRIIFVVVSDEMEISDVMKMTDENVGFASLLFFKFTGDAVEQIVIAPAVEA